MNHCTKAGLDLNAKAELWVVLLQSKIVSVHVVAFPTPLASPYHPFRATEKKQASKDDLHSCGWHLWFANLNTRMQGKNSIHLFECEYNLFISCHDFETLNTKWLQIWGTSTKPFMGTDSEFVQILTENVGHIRQESCVFLSKENPLCLHLLSQNSSKTIQYQARSVQHFRHL